MKRIYNWNFGNIVQNSHYIQTWWKIASRLFAAQTVLQQANTQDYSYQDSNRDWHIPCDGNFIW